MFQCERYNQVKTMTLDKFTIANAKDVSQICDTQDWDVLITLDGGERGGKSSVMADLLLVWEPSVERDILCGIYESFLGRYAWSWGEWYDLLKASNNRAVIREEADFLGRESMTEINRRILRVITTVGRRNNKMGLLFPDFWRLDLYARERTRIRGFVHARNITEEGPTRGYVNWYVRHRFPFPRSSDGATIWWYQAFTGHFKHISKTSPQHAEAWARFREIEEISKNRILEDSAIDPRKKIAVELKKRGMTIRIIGEIMNVSRASVGVWVKGIQSEMKTEPLFEDGDRKVFLESLEGDKGL